MVKAIQATKQTQPASKKSAGMKKKIDESKKHPTFIVMTVNALNTLSKNNRKGTRGTQIKGYIRDNYSSISENIVNMNLKKAIKKLVEMHFIRCENEENPGLNSHYHLNHKELKKDKNLFKLLSNEPHKTGSNSSTDSEEKKGKTPVKSKSVAKPGNKTVVKTDTNKTSTTPLKSTPKKKLGKPSNKSTTKPNEKQTLKEAGQKKKKPAVKKPPTPKKNGASTGKITKKTKSPSTNNNANMNKAVGGRSASRTKSPDMTKS